MTPCSASVEKIQSHLWEVTVIGVKGKRRVYTIFKRTDDMAAEEGIRRFVDEMENLDLHTNII